MMRTLKIVRSVILLIALLVSASASAEAPPDNDTRARARALGEEGNALYDKGDYAAALDRYERAAELVKVPTLGLKAARCLDKLGRLVEASEKYLAVTRMTLADDALDVHREAVVSAEQEREALQPRIPSIVVTVKGSGVARMTLDGRDYAAVLIGVKSLIDPGSHRIEARAEHAVAQKSFTIREGESLALELVLEMPKVEAKPKAKREPEQPPREERGWLSPVHGVGIGALVLGVAGLAVGGATTGILPGKRSDLEDRCGADLQCPPSAHDDADSYNTLRIVSTIGWIAGGVLAASGVVMIAVPNATEPSAAIWLTPSGLAGRF